MSAAEEKRMKEMQRRLEKQRRQLEDMPLPLIAESGKPETVMVSTHDGVGLSTTYFFPKGVEPPYPTIVVRTCYPYQREGISEQAAAYNRRGFAFVLQWCRGTEASEGKWEPNVNEREDGLALMENLQKDERIGNIGYFGDSYLALTGWAMADAVPSKVKAMYLGVYGCDRFCSAYKDGLFRQDILTAWALGNTGKEIGADLLASCKYRPQIQVDEDMWGVKLPWYRDWITHTDRDDPYWSEGFWGMLLKIPSKVKIPLYIRDGWFDHHMGSALNSWERLPEETKRISTLEIGPWDHGYQNVVSREGYADPQDNVQASVIEWFYHILVEEKIPQGKVKLFNIGGNRWDIYRNYPVPVSSEKTWYLVGEKLEQKAPEGEDSRTYLYDPETPLPSHGGEACFASMHAIGSISQPEIGYRKDVLSFVSDPLTEDLQSTGCIRVKLYVSSDAPDTAFSIKVMEVFPDGTALNVRNTITTLAYQENPDHRGVYNPGTIVPCELTSWACSWTMQKGSRIRLDISSSDFPQYAVHSNRAGIWSEIETTIPARQTIWFGGRYPSSVTFPIPVNSAERDK